MEETEGQNKRRRSTKDAPEMRVVGIDFTILILLRIGVPPRGSPVSGCRIVSKALGLSEHTVERIWRRSFGLVMQKHSKAIAIRTGLSQFHPSED